MVTMTIIAGRDVGGDIGLPKGHRLAMVGFAIMGQFVLVAPAAALITRHLEVPVARSLDFMRAMAIRAHRSPLVPLQEQLAVHTLKVSLLHPMMALAAGFCHVQRVDR